MAEFDLAILGAGSGNTILDERFESWRVAIVEADRFGGTCLNRGCVPTKMLVHPADLVTALRSAGPLGVDARLEGVRWTDIRDRVFGRIDPLVADGARFRRSQDHVTVFSGASRFTGPGTLRVESGEDAGAEVRATRWVVAAGARPHLPEVDGLADVPFHTSDTIMRIDAVPERLVVIGGGFISSELAHVFEAFGSKVSVVTRSGGLLTHHDPDVSERFTRIAAQRFDLHLAASVESVSGDERAVAVTTRDPDGARRVVEGDMLLVAAGRVPNSDTVAVERAGIDVDHRGFIRTDDTLATSAPGVWALGDIRTPLMLKHVANHEAHVCRHNLLHPAAPLRVDERFVPHAVFTAPQVAAVGLTEPEALETGRRVVTAVRRYADTAHGWALEDSTGICKLVADADTGLLLGAHLLGPQASLLVQLLVQGMRFGQTVRQLAHDQMYIHPALTEVVEQALLELLDGFDAAVGERGREDGAGGDDRVRQGP